ncbi:hypothetical protein D3C71_1753640 [compost metagenome]
MQRHGQRADINGIAAFAAHVFRQLIDVGLRILLAVDGFNVPLANLLVRGFMRQHHDAFLARLLQHRLQHLGVVRHHDDGVDVLGDQVFNHFHLCGRVWGGRPGLVGIDVELFGRVVNADFHTVEPGNAGHFGNHGNLVLFSSKGRCCR